MEYSRKIVYLLTIKTSEGLDTELYYSYKRAYDIAEYIRDTEIYEYLIIMKVNTLSGDVTVLQVYKK